MKHGKQHDITILDGEGSQLKDTTSIYDYKEGSKFRRYEIRVRVHNDAEELQQYLEFQKIKTDKIDPVFIIQKAKHGTEYYHIIKCYTERVEL